MAEMSESTPLPSTPRACAVVPSLTPLKTYVPGLVSEIVFGLSLYSVSWTLTVLITAPPEDAELVVEVAVEAALVPPPESPQPPETAATTTTTAPSRVSRCVLISRDTRLLIVRFSALGGEETKGRKTGLTVTHA